MSSCFLPGIERNSQDFKKEKLSLAETESQRRHRVQIAFCAKVAGTVSTIKIPTHAYCVGNYKLKLQLYIHLLSVQQFQP